MKISSLLNESDIRGFSLFKSRFVLNNRQVILLLGVFIEFLPDLLVEMGASLSSETLGAITLVASGCTHTEFIKRYRSER